MSGDAADEAAGEEIFSSDGRDPPVLTSPPPLKTPETEDATALLETTGISPAAAFEVFAGKIYPTAGASATRTTAGSTETPWQRLARLQRETQELEQDLAPLQPQSADSADAGTTSLLQSVRELQGRLAQPVTSSTAWQERLTLQVAESSASLQRVTSVGSMEGAAAAPSSDTSADWEARLRKLEKMVGVGVHESHSMLERLTVLEQAAAKLSEKDLEVAMKKAKVIRQDLEAASKARNKLISSRDANAESSKSIAALHDQMTQLQGLTTILPALTQRLQALATQHTQATTWTQRLAATERHANQLQTVTSKLDDSVQQLEESLKATADQMTKNMKALDSKLP